MDSPLAPHETAPRKIDGGSRLSPVNDAIAFCLSRGVTITPQSHAMIRYLAESGHGGHTPTAAEIWLAVNAQERIVSISTVQRALRRYRDIGLVVPAKRTDGRGGYRLDSIPVSPADTPARRTSRS